MSKRNLSVAFLLLITLALSTPWASSQQEEAPFPAYHSGPPAKGTKLPPILTKDQLVGSNAQYPFQIHAYELAAKIPVVLYQEPCYCHCDRMGHTSLHSCFSGTHGAECSTCMKELYYSYIQTKKGKTPAEIRAGIINGEWRDIDLRTAVSIE
jgi:hypothetical protein